MTFASSPGKIMLAGEYAVLEGGRALAHSVGKRLTVKVIPREDHTWISSQLWPEKKIYDPRSPELSCQAIKYFEDHFGKLPPLEIKIQSEIVVSHGIGSSSALRLSLFASLQKHLNLNFTPLQIAKLAYGDQKRAQGKASGYDTLTQALGGLIEMSIEKSGSEKNWPLSYRKTKSNLLKHVHIMTGGKGAPTSETLDSVSAWLQKNKKSKDLLTLSENLLEAWLGDDLGLLLNQMESHRLFFEDAPAFPRFLGDALKPYKDLLKWNWKTTGAGGEDALILVGQIPDPVWSVFQSFGWKTADFAFNEDGLEYDSN